MWSTVNLIFWMDLVFLLFFFFKASPLMFCLLHSSLSSPSSHWVPPITSTSLGVIFIWAVAVSPAVCLLATCFPPCFLRFLQVALPRYLAGLFGVIVYFVNKADAFSYLYEAQSRGLVEKCSRQAAPLPSSQLSPSWLRAQCVWTIWTSLSPEFSCWADHNLRSISFTLLQWYIASWHE